MKYTYEGVTALVELFEKTNVDIGTIFIVPERDIICYALMPMYPIIDKYTSTINYDVRDEEKTNEFYHYYVIKNYFVVPISEITLIRFTRATLPNHIINYDEEKELGHGRIISYTIITKKGIIVESVSNDVFFEEFSNE